MQVVSISLGRGLARAMRVALYTATLFCTWVAQAQTVPQWTVGVRYVAGAKVTYASNLYQALQTHTAQSDWAPATTPALWKPLSQSNQPCTAVPQAPAGLTAANTTPSGTTLSWSAASLSNGCAVSVYSIYQNGILIASAANLSLTVSGLTPSATYAFTVTATDQAGTSAPSSALSVTTTAPGIGPACATPWSATATYTASMRASIAGANYSANWWTQGQSPASNSGAAGSGQPWTLVGSCAACAALPATPTGLVATATAATRTTLSWTPATPPQNCTITSYTVLRNGSPIGAATSGTFVATGLTPSTSYTFAVSAVDEFGASSLTSTLAVTTPPPGIAPGRLFAPYIDMSMTASEQLATIQQQSGIHFFTLAFVLGNGTCTPYWGGTTSVANDSLPGGGTIAGLIDGVRNAGGDVIVSFGGANGTELALSCPDPASLQAAYQAVVTKYGVSMIDFDIEGGAVADQASITRRDKALVALKAANPGLVISYTLPVLPTGLDSNGVNVLRSVKADGLTLDVVNVMAMDYGASVDNGGQMGLNATQAASNTYSQILAAGLNASVGVTPMIGNNDVSPEKFQFSDAAMLLNFALANSWISRLAFWSVGRDNGSCGGFNWASADCSGMVQSPYQFSGIFNAYR